MSVVYKDNDDEGDDDDDAGSTINAAGHHPNSTSNKHFIDAEDADQILERLEQLRLWQESQTRILHEKQLTQRELLNLEQQKLYQLLGLSFNNSNDNNNNNSSTVGSSNINDSILNDDEFQSELQQHQLTKDLSASINHNNNNNNNNKNPSLENIPKRPFLKRGEGLKMRFKIDPDKFNLKNLPKYKYSTTTNTTLRPKRKHPPDDDGGDASKHQIESTNENKRKSNQNYNLLKFNNPQQQSHKNVKLVDELKVNDDEESFVNNDDRDDDDQLELIDNWTKENVIERVKSMDCNNQNEKCSIVWSNRLELKDQQQKQQQQSHPLNSIHDNSMDTQNEIDDLNIFELLEKKTENSSFSSDASVIQKFIYSKKLKERQQQTIRSEPDDPLIDYPKKKLPAIKPYPFDVDTKTILLNSNDEQSNSSSTTTNSSDSSDDDDDDSTSDDFNSNNNNGNFKKPIKQQVKFSDNIEIFNDSNLPSEIDEISSITQTSTPQKIKALQFSSLQLKTANHHNDKLQHDENPVMFADKQCPAAEEEEEEQQEEEVITLKTQLKLRLQQLENEIQLFESQNMALTKLKQKFELEKIEFEQAKELEKEQQNDERIKFEVYLHDERMQLLKERKEFDCYKKECLRKQQLALNRRDRDEICKLKEHIDRLQKESTDKDQKHTVAQSRTRAQLRLMEKDLKDNRQQSEQLQMDNKKLETENVRLRRQNNNKMLTEINRNLQQLRIEKNDEKDKEGKNHHPMAKQSTAAATKSIVNKSKNQLITAKVISHNRSRSVPNLYEPKKCINKNESLSLSSSSSSISTSFDDMDNENHFKGKEKTSNYIQTTVNYDVNPKADDVEDREDDDDDKEVKPISIDCNEKNSSTSLKREIQNLDGSKNIWYPNGNLKKISTDGMLITMLYFNKDIKETNINEGTIRYYYAETNTWHTTYLDGLEILEFPSGQTEHRHKDGKVEVNFPNGSIRITNPNDGEIIEQWKYSDGTSIVQKRNGEKILQFTNGQCEIHTAEHKRRIYPDGTIKIVFPDGSQETRYSNGRIRLRDKSGNLLMDSGEF